MIATKLAAPSERVAASKFTPPRRMQSSAALMPELVTRVSGRFQRRAPAAVSAVASAATPAQGPSRPNQARTTCLV